MNTFMHLKDDHLISSHEILHIYVTYNDKVKNPILVCNIALGSNNVPSLINERIQFFLRSTTGSNFSQLGDFAASTFTHGTDNPIEFHVSIED
jgi:hypothetical protein